MCTYLHCVSTRNTIVWLPIFYHRMIDNLVTRQPRVVAAPHIRTVYSMKYARVVIPPCCVFVISKPWVDLRDSFTHILRGRFSDMIFAVPVIEPSFMMTSSNENIFHVTGHFCGEFTGPGEFPAQRPVTRALMFSLIYTWINDWVNKREAGDLRRHLGHYDVIVMHQTTNTQLRANCTQNCWDTFYLTIDGWNSCWYCTPTYKILWSFDLPRKLSGKWFLGIHFTNNSWSHYQNLGKLMRLDHNSAHTCIAIVQLSWHVQDCELIGSSESRFEPKEFL